jgi:hypothetical protein
MMGRGKLSEETKAKRALEEAAKVFELMGGSAEEFSSIPVELPAETTLDKMREAESAIIYFDTQGYKFKEKQCKFCGGTFAYRWNVTSISHCSIECAKGTLKQIGLTWDPSRDQSRRWGRYLPVVVPPAALTILKGQLNDSLGDQPPDIIA